MIDTSKFTPEKGTLGYKLLKFFIDRVNFCHGARYDEYDNDGNPVEKPENKIYNCFYKYWLWPFEQTGCACCNTVRGLFYGAVIGFLVGRLL